jgi:hypothetical protein
MAEQSSLSRLPKKLLTKLSMQLVDNGFDFQNPYDGDYDENYTILTDLGRVISVDIMEEDYQFMCKFIEVNDDILSKLFEKSDQSLYDKLIIPMAKDFKVSYSEWGHCTYDNAYIDKVSSYDESWVEGSIRQQYQDGNWDLWGGKLIDTVYDNAEMNDWSIDNVSESISESKSLLGRLVVENTSEVISSLDKQTLLELKQIIDSRLRSL